MAEQQQDVKDLKISAMQQALTTLQSRLNAYMQAAQKSANAQVELDVAMSMISQQLAQANATIESLKSQLAAKSNAPSV